MHERLGRTSAPDRYQHRIRDELRCDLRTHYTLKTFCDLLE